MDISYHSQLLAKTTAEVSKFAALMRSPYAPGKSRWWHESTVYRAYYTDVPYSPDETYRQQLIKEGESLRISDQKDEVVLTSTIRQSTFH